MATWYLNRPENKADATEVAVAQKLKAKLNDDWKIRWGYYYEKSGAKQPIDKEGDFIYSPNRRNVPIIQLIQGIPSATLGAAAAAPSSGTATPATAPTQSSKSASVLNQTTAITSAIRTCRSISDRRSAYHHRLR